MPPPYGITISPPLNDLDIYTGQEGIKRLLKVYIDCYISRLRSQILLYPELDKNNRLHFHGYIWKEDIGFYEHDIKLLKKWCFIKLEDIKLTNRWNKYISKEWHLTKSFLGLKSPLKNCFKHDTKNVNKLLDQIKKYAYTNNEHSEGNI